MFWRDAQRGRRWTDESMYRLRLRAAGAAVNDPGQYAGLRQNIPDGETVAADEGITLNLCQCPSCGLVQFDCEPVDYYRM